MYIMEAKALDAYPIWFIKALSELKIYSASFSKYGSIYSKNLKEELYGNKTYTENVKPK